eukprot:s4106_g8.t1
MATPVAGPAADVVHLSSRYASGSQHERMDYSHAKALLVACSTLAQLIPDKGVQKFSQQDIWEMPCVTLMDVAARADDSWSYPGCSICLKRSCAHGGSPRQCYKVELQVVDHTATVEVTVWTEVMGKILMACGYADPSQGVSSVEEALGRMRNKTWSVRCVIVEDAPYQNRPARNKLQMVSIKEQRADFAGTAKPLFAVRPEDCRPGLPAAFLREVAVDAAEQVTIGDGTAVDMVELLVRIKGDPQQQSQPGEKGVRIGFQCLAGPHQRRPTAAEPTRRERRPHRIPVPGCGGSERFGDRAAVGP